MKRKYQLLWIEPICNIPEIIENNIFKVKIKSDDYKGWNDQEKAAEDFRKRIKAYEKEYTNISAEKDGQDTTFIQIIDNTEIKMRNIGELETKILAYLVNLHTGERPIYFMSTGESINDSQGILGGDTDLTPDGITYAKLANNFFKDKLKEFNRFSEECIVMCSKKKQGFQTAKELTCFKNFTEVNLLDELNYGFQDNLTEEEFYKKYPEEEEEKKKDPLNYRYPNGESYSDIIERTERIIHDIERHCGPVILIVKENVLRCLYGYFAFEGEVKTIEQIPNIQIPKSTIIEFTPEAYGFKKELFAIETKKGVRTCFRKYSGLFLQDMSVFFNPSPLSEEDILVLKRQPESSRISYPNIEEEDDDPNERKNDKDVDSNK